MPPANRSANIREISMAKAAIAFAESAPRAQAAIITRDEARTTSAVAGKESMRRSSNLGTAIKSPTILTLVSSEKTRVISRDAGMSEAAVTIHASAAHMAGADEATMAPSGMTHAPHTMSFGMPSRCLASESAARAISNFLPWRSGSSRKGRLDAMSLRRFASS